MFVTSEWWLRNLCHEKTCSGGLSEELKKSKNLSKKTISISKIKCEGDTWRRVIRWLAESAIRKWTIKLCCWSRLILRGTVEERVNGRYVFFYLSLQGNLKIWKSLILWKNNTSRNVLDNLRLRWILCNPRTDGRIYLIFKILYWEIYNNNWWGTGI